MKLNNPVPPANWKNVDTTFVRLKSSNNDPFTSHRRVRIDSEFDVEYIQLKVTLPPRTTATLLEGYTLTAKQYDE